MAKKNGAGESLRSRREQGESSRSRTEQGESSRSRTEQGERWRRRTEQGQSSRSRTEQEESLQRRTEQGESSRSRTEQEESLQRRMEQGESSRRRTEQEERWRRRTDQGESLRSRIMEQGESSQRRMDEEEVFWTVIWPAIQDKSCAICFKDLECHYKEAAVLTGCAHAYCMKCIRKWCTLKRTCPLCNSGINSWYCRLSHSSRSFRKEAVSSGVLDRNSEENTGANQLVPISRILIRRITELRNRRQKARPKRQRSFEQKGLVSLDDIAKRKRAWRASIYKKGLRAVPAASTCRKLYNWRNTSTKKEILSRIKPWIQRELEAVLADPDPTVFVHEVTSQFIAWLQEKSKLPSGELDDEYRFISRLYPFLDVRARIFWHELRCFAESSYDMETYDEIVEYEPDE